MIHRRILRDSALALVLAWSSAGQAQSQAAPSIRSVWDSVYSAGQATRGERQYEDTCRHCHGNDAVRGEEVALWGDEFWKSWREDSVGNMYLYVRDNMPNDEPGTLSDQQYLDVIAYLLSRNGFPAGSQALTAQSATDVRIMRKEGPGPLPAETMVSVVGCLVRGAAGWELANSTPPRRVTHSENAASAAAGTALPDPQGGILPLKFVMTKLDDHVGKVMVVTGALIGEGGSEGINVMTTTAAATTCDAPS